MGSGSIEDLNIFKRQLVKIYSSSGQYLSVWPDAPLLSGFKETINGGTSSLTVQLPRQFDSFGQPSYPGSVQDVAQGNVVQYWLFGPGLPQTGKLRYQGYIEKYEPSIDERGKEVCTVTIMPYSVSIGADRGLTVPIQFGIANNASTYIDPVAMFGYWFNHNDPITTLPYVSPLTLDPGNPTSSGIVTQYTFQNQKMDSILQTILLMLPPNWFYRVNANKTVTFNAAPTTAQHTFYLGQHLIKAKYSQDWMNLKNTIYLEGKGVSSTKIGSDIAQFGQRLYMKKESRVTDTTTVNLLAQGLLNYYDQALLRAPLVVADYRGDTQTGIGYDIESIQVGDTIQLLDTTGNASQSNWDTMHWDVDGWDFSGGAAFSNVVQIVELTYNFDSVEIMLGSYRPNQNREVLHLERELQDFTLISNA